MYMVYFFALSALFILYLGFGFNTCTCLLFFIFWIITFGKCLAHLTKRCKQEAIKQNMFTWETEMYFVFWLWNHFANNIKKEATLNSWKVNSLYLVDVPSLLVVTSGRCPCLPPPVSRQSSNIIHTACIL